MKHVALTAALIALVATDAAAAAAQTCIPQREAEALMMTAAPSVIASVAQTCAATLPANAYLRRSADRLSAKFAGEADAAWPLAREAMRKVTGPDTAGMLDSELARPMVGAMAGPLIARNVKSSDCPTIDRVLTLVDPLPARNAAALIVIFAEIAARDQRTGLPPICKVVER